MGDTEEEDIRRRDLETGSGRNGGGEKDRAFDIQNIATHEFGHPVGLDDLYDEIYSELTMYGYSSKGETKKCSLEEGDVLGAQSLYRAP